MDASKKYISAIQKAGKNKVLKWTPFCHNLFIESIFLYIVLRTLIDFCGKKYFLSFAAHVQFTKFNRTVAKKTLGFPRPLAPAPFALSLYSTNIDREGKRGRAKNISRASDWKQQVSWVFLFAYEREACRQDSTDTALYSGNISAIAEIQKRFRTIGVPVFREPTAVEVKRISAHSLRCVF